MRNKLKIIIDYDKLFRVEKNFQMFIKVVKIVSTNLSLNDTIIS